MTEPEMSILMEAMRQIIAPPMRLREWYPGVVAAQINQSWFIALENIPTGPVSARYVTSEELPLDVSATEVVTKVADMAKRFEAELRRFNNR